MSEERKLTAFPEATADCARSLRRFAGALVSPLSDRAADALAQTALARVASAEGARGDARERAYAEIVRLNRRRLREQGRTSEAAAAAETRDASIAGQIAAMPLDEREALLIVTLAGLGYEAAARALDLPYASFVSRLMRARARLDAARAGAQRRPGHLRIVK